MATALSVRRRGGMALRSGATALYTVRRLLTSVRSAIVVILMLAIALMLGMLLPQIPAGVRGQPDLTAVWLELQEEHFGLLTPLLHWLRLFDVFHAWWFLGLLAWLVLAVTACSTRRLPPLWRQAFHPPRRIADGLFDRSTAVPVRGELTTGRVERELSRRRFKIWRQDEGDSTYLFADRFQWASLGTALTHLGLIVFLAGALLTKVDAFSTSLTIAEGGTAPVFPVKNENQIQVGVTEAVGSFSETGRPLDYHSDLVLYRNGEEAKRCTITVNDPCSLDGYRFHQAGFFGFGAELRVHDLETGNVLYQETLALSRALPSPQLTIRRDDGTSLFDGSIPQTDLIEGSLGSFLSVPETGKMFWVGLKGGEPDWTLVVFDPSEGDAGDRAFIPMEGSALVSGMQFEFSGVTSLPSLMADGIPLPVTSTNPEDDGLVLLAMENGVYGTWDVSAGDERPGLNSDEPPVLHIVGIAPLTVRLAEGDRIQLGPYEYEFVGPRNFAGISVRKDRGDTLIWVATGLFISGLALTLWLPRSRAWFRVRPGDLRMVSKGRGSMDPLTLFEDDRQGEEG